METQYNVLGCRIDIYFHDYKLAIEIDEKGHQDRNQDYEAKREELIKKELDCKFIRINLMKKALTLLKSITKCLGILKN